MRGVAVVVAAGLLAAVACASPNVVNKNHGKRTAKVAQFTRFPRFSTFPPRPTPTLFPRFFSFPPRPTPTQFPRFFSFPPRPTPTQFPRFSSFPPRPTPTQFPRFSTFPPRPVLNQQSARFQLTMSVDTALSSTSNMFETLPSAVQQFTARAIGGGVQVTSAGVDSVCPASACRGGCPLREAERIASGCLSGQESTLRAAKTLENVVFVMHVDVESDSLRLPHTRGSALRQIEADVASSAKAPSAELKEWAEKNCGGCATSVERVEVDHIAEENYQRHHGIKDQTNLPVLLAIVSGVTGLLSVCGVVAFFAVRRHSKRPDQRNTVPQEETMLSLTTAEAGYKAEAPAAAGEA